jgi:hypothetical protein
MARIEIEAGETLNFTIPLTNESGQPFLLSNLDNIIALVYTDKTNKVKCSLVEKTGYVPINEVNTNTIQFLILSEKTKKFNGILYYELVGIKDNKSVTIENNGLSGAVDAGIYVKNNYGKDEL